MKIINKTTGEHIGNDAIECKTLISKIIGLMFTKKKKTLIFKIRKEQQITIHMKFVKNPIDIILLNHNKEVIEIKENLQINETYKTKNKIKYLIETPKGTIKNTRTKVTDKIKLYTQ